MSDVIKVGLIGAGANTFSKHVPGFRKQGDVEIVAVANRSYESSQRAADALNIPNPCRDWMEIVEDEEIDAVCIGTWPYMHATVTTAALDEGKHVLCEARMAMNSQEALEMLETSRDNPELTCQVVPAPHTLSVDKTVMKMISNDFLGELVNARILVGSGGFPDQSLPFHWRHNREFSGNNIMTMGIWYEAIMRWIGPANSVLANAQTVIKFRKDSDGTRQSISIPDHVDILCNMACGGVMNMAVTAVAGFAPSADVWLHGSKGTIRVQATDFTDPGAPNLSITAGRAGDIDMKVVEPLSEDVGYWRVEEEFINAIRGIEEVTRTSFSDGFRYMQWTDAVTESWQTGKTVSLLFP